MIIFTDLCNQLNNWYTQTNGATTQTAANTIMNPLIEFDLSNVPPLDSSNSPVNVYVGYNGTYLLLAMIQKSKDIESRYTTDLTGVLGDMVVVSANYRSGGIVDVPHSPLLPNQITNAVAITRIADFANSTKRMDVMLQQGFGPIMFEVPKSNFLLPGNKKAILGIKKDRIKRVDVPNFDLIFENWETGQEASKMYFDSSISFPPHRVVGDYGLYQYLNHDLS